MQKIRENANRLKVVSAIADALIIVYVLLYFYWMFFVENMDTHFLTEFFVKINPMTWGTYLVGAAMLIHLIAFKNIIWRCILVTFYVLAVIVSLVAIMGMTSWLDLHIFIPHVFIIGGSIVILYKQYKNPHR